MGIGSGGCERREVRDWPENQGPSKRRWIWLTLEHLDTVNSQATRMLVWGATPKHLGEPGSTRKKQHKNRVNREGCSDKIHFQGRL